MAYPSDLTDAQLELSDRVYECDACCLVLDRDGNAAINLARWTPEGQPQAAAA